MVLRTLWIGAALYFGLSIPGYTESFECTSGTKRTVEIKYIQQNGQAPCEVSELKNGIRTSLWRAENSVDYCIEKFNLYPGTS